MHFSLTVSSFLCARQMFLSHTCSHTSAYHIPMNNNSKGSALQYILFDTVINHKGVSSQVLLPVHLERKGLWIMLFCVVGITCMIHLICIIQSWGKHICVSQANFNKNVIMKKLEKHHFLSHQLQTFLSHSLYTWVLG